MMDHAELFKELRTERKISQKALSLGISTRSAVAAFEYRHTNLSLEYAVAYLERMNITLDEYMYLYNKNHLSKKRELTQLVSQKHKHSVGPLLKDEYEKTNDLYYYFLNLELELIQLHQEGFDFSSNLPKELKQKAKKIREHLDRVETWGRFELSMFTNCSFLFDTPYIIFNLNYSLKKMKDYQEKTYQSQFLGVLLQNCISLALERNSSELLEATLEHIKNYQPTHTDMLSCLLGRFFERIGQLSPEDYENDVELNLLLQTMDLFNLTNWSMHLKNYYSLEVLSNSKGSPKKSHL